MTNRESIEAEALRRYPVVFDARGLDVNWAARAAYIAGASRQSPAEPVEATREEVGQVVLDHFHGPDALHSSWWINTDEMGDALRALFIITPRPEAGV